MEMIVAADSISINGVEVTGLKWVVDGNAV